MYWMNMIIIQITNPNNANNCNNANNGQNINCIPVFFSSLIELINLMKNNGNNCIFHTSPSHDFWIGNALKSWLLNRLRAQVMIIECLWNRRNNENNTHNECNINSDKIRKGPKSCKMMPFRMRNHSDEEFYGTVSAKWYVFKIIGTTHNYFK